VAERSIDAKEQIIASVFNRIRNLFFKKYALIAKVITDA
jgi:hypothetical protein